jgi:hypothetical protein
VEKPVKSISIREIISEEKKLISEENKKSEIIPQPDNEGVPEEELNIGTFEKAWTEFTGLIKGDGPRILSMFKSVKTEVENDQAVKIHLSNAAQKDLFIQNYKPKLAHFLKKKFGTKEIDIETIVDLSESNDILYTDEQKYNYMVSKHPGLKDFKKSFNLDIT